MSTTKPSDRRRDALRHTAEDVGGRQRKTYKIAHVLIRMATLEQLHRELEDLKRAVLHIQHLLESQQRPIREDDEAGLELADDVVAEIAASRKRKRSDFVSHESIMKQYAVK